MNYTIYSLHQVQFNPDIPLETSLTCPVLDGIGDYFGDCFLDPEGFWGFPLRYDVNPFPAVPWTQSPNFTSTDSSETEEITGSMTGTGSYQVIPGFSTTYVQEYGWPYPDGYWWLATTSAVYPCPIPIISSISPNVWFTGQSYNITITGTGFIPSEAATSSCKTTTVSVSSSGTNPNITVPVSNINVVSATEITATVAPTSSPASGGGVSLLPPSKGAAGLTLTVKNPFGQEVTGLGASGVSATTQVDVLDNPQIVCGGSSMQCNGSVISGGAAAANAVVGQAITLTTQPSAATLAALPIPLTFASTTWTVGGTNIGGYSAANDIAIASVTPTTLTGSGLTTYWAYPGSAIPVTYQYCINPGGLCITAETASFNVTGPVGGSMPVLTFSPTVTIGSFTSCGDNPGGPYLIYGAGGGLACSGEGTITTAGIGFGPPTGYTNTNGGSFEIVQLISGDVITGGAGGSYGTGIDSGSYPYSTTFPAYDSPKLYLPPTATNVTRTFTATMFLMWQSGTANSIAVPIGYQTWGFSGGATCSSSCGTVGNWTALNLETQGPIGGFNPSTPSQTSVPNTNIVLQYGFPIWGSISLVQGEELGVE